jgi:hypothetical protein
VGGGTLLVRADGSVLTWGRPPRGLIPAPTLVDLPGKVRRVAVGGANTGGFSGYALLEGGTVVSWGDNDEGQHGNGATGDNRPLGTYPKPSAAPVTVTGLTDVIDIGAGTKHAVALRADGTVWAWGMRDEGALGGGDVLPAGSLRVVSAMAPVRVAALEGITQIAPVEASSRGSVAERSEIPSDCRRNRSAKWSHLSRANRVRWNTTTKRHLLQESHKTASSDSGTK